MRKIKACGFSFLLLVMAPLFVAPLLGAQELNSVPLDHASYDIIEFGVIRGLVSPPPLAKPWSVRTVREKLWEMLDGPPGVLSPKEIEIIDNVLDSLKGKSGLDLQRGKYRIEKDRLTFETGIGWESGFSVDFPYFARLKKDAEYSGEAFASVNTAEIYACGDLGAFFSWNVTALGELLGIGRYENDEPLALPWSLSKGWDRGVISMREPGAYSAWPDDPALAGSLLGEVNTASAGESLQLRLGRIRRDWGPQANGTSLFMNAQARPFLGFEWINSPVPWVYYYILLGGTEYYRESEEWPGNGPVSNTLAAAQFEINPVRFLHFGLGGSAVLQETLNTAVFTDIELRLPGIFKLWGSLFVDSLDSPNENFPLMNSNSYAWQAGIKAAVNWLPFAAFTLRYTKIEPYCYTNPYEGRTRAWSPPDSGYFSGGESLGYYLPPNSDELLLRFETRFFFDVKTYVQYQAIRHGAEYGYGRVSGSSLTDVLADKNSQKFFLMDGVYQWDAVIKLGGSFTLKTGVLPLSVYAEAGLVNTRFTINGAAGPGREADYDFFSDSVYRAGNGFVFSAGFRLFSGI